MRLIIDVDDNDYNLLNKTEIQIDLSTAFYGKEKDRKMTFALFNLAKALKNGTPIPNEGDLISREALRNEVDTWGCNDYDKYDFLEAIDNAPKEEPDCLHCKQYQGGYDYGYNIGYNKGKKERPHSEWIVDEDNDIFRFMKCSNCGEVAEWLDGGSQFLSKFCPNCGADMRGGANANG